MASIDYVEARKFLDDCLLKLDKETFEETLASFPIQVQKSTKILFESKTQSYREVALGCAVIRLFNRTINLSLPYINLGENSYNGRTLDEKVINPFLYSNEIPASKGPYLATFRRSITIDNSIRNSQKDKNAYDSLLNVLEYLQTLMTSKEIIGFISTLLSYFISLRDQSKIELAKIKKLHLEQHKIVLHKLLDTPSGGLLPVLVAVALLNTINDCFSLQWEISWQGINESDLASGTGGDITVKKANEIQFVLEVTERPIDNNRIVSTFNSKIVRKGITDYLFIYKNNQPSQETKDTAGRYFAQGHEINFIQITDWVLNNLATIGPQCRSHFLEILVTLIDAKEVSSTVKVKWNEVIRTISGN